MEFTTFSVPTDTGKNTDVWAFAIPETGGALAIQQIPCTDGEVVYGILHVPTGRLMAPKWAFDDKELLASRLIDAWEELTLPEKQLFGSTDAVAIHKSSGLKSAIQYVVNAANIRMGERDPRNN